MAFEIRPFLPAYSEAVLAVAHAAIPYDPGGNRRWMRERQQVDEQHLRRRHYIVANTGEGIVGYGAIEQQPPDAPQRMRVYLLVYPGYLRGGAGRMLFGQLMKDVEALKVNSLWMQEYQKDEELLNFMNERGFVQTRLTWEWRLTLSKTNVTQRVSIVEEVAQQDILITSLEEERLRAPNVAGRLHELYNAIQEDAFAPLTFQEFLQRLDRPRIMPQGFFVARQGERLIGLNTLAYIEGDSEQALQHWTGVLPAYRHRHVATALRLCSIDVAQRLGYQTLVSYNAYQESLLQTLNEKLGFHRLFGYVTLEKTV